MKEDLAKHQRKRAGGSMFGLQSVIILEKKKRFEESSEKRNLKSLFKNSRAVKI